MCQCLSAIDMFGMSLTWSSSMEAYRHVNCMNNLIEWSSPVPIESTDSDGGDHDFQFPPTQLMIPPLLSKDNSVVCYGVMVVMSNVPEHTTLSLSTTALSPP